MTNDNRFYPPKKNFAWLQSDTLQTILNILCSDEDDAKIVGGAVRNSLLGLKIVDIDIATTSIPEQTMERLRAKGYRCIPTGIEHGTITVMTPERAYEVTTIRKDVKTDGRHAKVEFGHDWAEDAKRRDFTMNALYLTKEGQIVDYINGLSDLRKQHVCFIGDASKRIQEDYLRILRFFRFYTWYGRGKPDASALKACAALKSGLLSLPAERIWSEFKNILSAPEPTRGILWMRQSSVLSTILPESKKWGLDHFLSLIKHGEDHGDLMRRFFTMIPPREQDVRNLSKRLNFSNAEQKRALDWRTFSEISLETLLQKKSAFAYYGVSEGFLDALHIRLANAQIKNSSKRIEQKPLRDLLAYFSQPKTLQFPITSQDLFSVGLEPGPKFGHILKKLELIWIESEYQLTRSDLLEKLKIFLNEYN